jgi:chorismate dehydratase
VVSATAAVRPRASADRESSAGLLRLGAVSYLNAEPTVHGLEREPGFRVERDVPSRVAERLHAGEVDLGLVPSIEYCFGRYAIVPGIAIASRGPVRSVRLFYRGSLESIRKVALDTSSRTSVALVRILLRERLGADPEYVAMAPDVGGMLDAADAALVIGDPALDHEHEAPTLDLGAEWRSLTGLPFVFAFWAGRPGAVSREQVAALQASLRAGIEAIPAIAAAYPRQSPGKGPENEEYLRSNIVYDLGEAEQAGLREFYRRAAGLGLIPSVPELRFHGDS